MFRKTILFVSLFISACAVGVALWLIRHNRCQRRCAKAVALAEKLAAAGSFLAALGILDQVDAACNCSTFTAGDEPPEYTAARVYLDELLQQQGQAAIAYIPARGPILRALLNLD